MRWIYAFVVIFLIASYFFAEWYLCNIQGLCTDDSANKTVDKTLAILEILMMLLVVFLLGFAAAWLLRDSVIKQFRDLAGRLWKDRGTLIIEKESLDRALNQSKRALIEFQQDNRLRIAQKEKAEKDAADLEVREHILQQELTLLNGRLTSSELEAERIRQKLLQAENQVVTERLEKERNIATVQKPDENKLLAPKPDRRSRFTPASWEVKDDLSLISGIGPVIHKKLNELGIYSFQQIAEFTPEDIDMVQKALKRFPDRIGRENWIGQAYALRKRK